MSLINQTIIRKGALVRRIDNYISGFASNGVFATMPMGTSTVSCSFATSTINHIQVNESSRYRISFCAYARLDIRSTNGTCYLALKAGSQNVGIFLTIAGSPVENTFKSSLFYDYNATALSGFLPDLVNVPSPIGIRANCNISASADLFINSSELIKLEIFRTAGGSNNWFAGLAGEIYLEQIS